MASTTRTTLVLLAAGMGSRYGGVKQIDGVGPNGEAIIDYSIYDALHVGFTDLCFVVRAEIEDAVREFFAGKFPDSIRVSYAVQSLDDLPDGLSVPAERSKPWGTAHAVYAARHAVNTPFAVVNADDFYGRDAYKTIHAYLSALANDETDYAMVGYQLEDTLSEHGTVSRGICEKDADGFLASIEEHTKIEQTGSRIVDTLDDGSTVELQPDDIASMNMFGFTPAVFPQIDDELGRFVRERGDDPKAEFYIPTLMTRLIETDRAQMRVLSTKAKWFGMTYREDKPKVQARVREYVESGVYPKKLWG
ncbi:MAG: nucleotidyltransferase family protein [Spirochaetota bacterium]